MVSMETTRLETTGYNVRLTLNVKYLCFVKML